MKEELEKKLFDEFSSFFRERDDPMKSLLYFGFECNDGWFQLIYDLCKGIKKIVDSNEDMKDLIVLQVKEKFGELRFYIGGGTKEIYNLIHEAEVKSSKTCEVCSGEGELMIRGGWYKTLCKKCAVDEYKGYRGYEEVNISKKEGGK